MESLNSHKLFKFSCYVIAETLFVPQACIGYHNRETQLLLLKYLCSVLCCLSPLLKITYF